MFVSSEVAQIVFAHYAITQGSLKPRFLFLPEETFLFPSFFLLRRTKSFFTAKEVLHETTLGFRSCNETGVKTGEYGET